MKYINYPRYLPVDEKSIENRRLRPEETSVQVRDTAVKSRRGYRKQQGLQIVTLRNIRVDEKPSVDYGVKYSIE